MGATELLASACAHMGVKFVYISTDYVFDGLAPPYRVESAPNPLSKYAETKLEGERATLACSQSNF